MTLPVRPGMTVPLPGPLHAHADRLRELADAGLHRHLVRRGGRRRRVHARWRWPRLGSRGCGSARRSCPAFTRAPGTLAQSVAAMADAAPGRFVVGIGSSSNVIVERWNGVPFDDPYQRVRDVVRFLRDALGGEKVAKSYDSFQIDGFRLSIRPEVSPPIVVAALREGMLRLAGREADGADPELALAGRRRPRGCRSSTPAARTRRSWRGSSCARARTRQRARAAGRYVIAAYLNVPGVRGVPRVAGPGTAPAGDVGRVEGR